MASKNYAITELSINRVKICICGKIFSLVYLSVYTPFTLACWWFCDVTVVTQGRCSQATTKNNTTTLSCYTRASTALRRTTTRTKIITTSDFDVDVRSTLSVNSPSSKRPFAITVTTRTSGRDNSSRRRLT